MANRQKDCILMKQAISKLLDSQSVVVPRNSALLKVLQPTTQNPPNYAKTHNKTAGQVGQQRTEWQRRNSPIPKKTAKKTGSKVLVLIAWILLALNILTVLGNLNYGTKLPLSLHTTENTNGCLLRIVMLALGVPVLGWTTWLYFRNKSHETIALPLLIVIALAVSLKFLKNESSGGQGLSRHLLSSFSTTTTPVYRLVTGILYSEDKPSAVIGNQIVYEGDTLHGINVVKIYKNKVEFEKNGKRWTQPVENRPVTY